MPRGDSRSGVERPARRRSAPEWADVLVRARLQGLSISDVVRETGASLVTVRRQARIHQMTLAPASSARKHIDWPREFKRAQRLGESTADLARRLKVGLSSVDKAKAQLGVRLLPGRGGAKACADWSAEFAQALASGEHLGALAKRLGVARQTASAAAKRLGITLRRKTPKSAPRARRPESVS